MKKLLCNAFSISVVTLAIAASSASSQENGPWNSPLMWAEEISRDVFTTPQIFQDSSGVPCVARKSDTDTMYCVFQWFREPRNTATWDRVATKMSSDGGATWTEPVPIVVDGLPAGWQRPFDPTIVFFKDSIRLYFSSSVRMPMGGLDSLVNTYSAVGVDGINYRFEPGARFDEPTRPVIDPAVVYANNSWLLTAPIGAPQEGAYQATSSDGLNFTRIADIPSDNAHNWTGNMMIDEEGTVRFYGSGQTLWRNPYNGFGSWGQFVSIGIRGGDPSAVARGPGKGRWIVFVGPRYVTLVGNTDLHDEQQSIITPNPVIDVFTITHCTNAIVSVSCVDILGRVFELPSHNGVVSARALPDGMYVVRTAAGEYLGRFVKAL